MVIDSETVDALLLYLLGEGGAGSVVSRYSPIGPPINCYNSNAKHQTPLIESLVHVTMNYLR